MDQPLTLSGVEPSLPARLYLDADHHERELQAIWYASWLYLCRAEDLARECEFRVFEVGRQSIRNGTRTRTARELAVGRTPRRASHPTKLHPTRSDKAGNAGITCQDRSPCVIINPPIMNPVQTSRNRVAVFVLMRRRHSSTAATGRTSDHGNIEDLTTGHTRNPAFAMLVGPDAHERSEPLESLLDVAAAVLGVVVIALLAG